MANGGDASYPLPEHPVLADAAMALRDAGQWATILDDRWRLVYATDEIRLTFGANIELATFAMGEHFFGPASVRASRAWRMGLNTTELFRRFFVGLGSLMLADAPGGREDLRAIVDPLFQDLVGGLVPANPAVSSFTFDGMGLGGPVGIAATAIRVRDCAGELAGTVVITKPAAGMA